MRTHLSVASGLGTMALCAVLAVSVMASPRHPQGTVGPAGWGMVVYGATEPLEPPTGALDPWIDPIGPGVAITPETGWIEAGRWVGWLANQSPAFGSNH